MTLGCSSASTAPVSEATVSFEEAMGMCREYCDAVTDGPSCEDFAGSRCYDVCMATYGRRAMLGCDVFRQCDRRGQCLEETMWAYFGCPASEGCNDTEGRCDDATQALERCRAQWEDETPAWCEENCPGGCESESEYPFGFGRSCLVTCERGSDCRPGSDCGGDFGLCVAECQRLRNPDGTTGIRGCGPLASCDNRGCCQPRSGLSRDQTGSYCDPP